MTPPTINLPLTVRHLHGLQLGVSSSVEALHLLLLQTLQEADGVFVHAPPLRQHQGGGAIVVTETREQTEKQGRRNKKHETYFQTTIQSHNPLQLQHVGFRKRSRCFFQIFHQKASSATDQMSIFSPLDTRNWMVSTWPHRCSAVFPW